MSVTAERFADAAKEWVGTPWHHAGRDGHSIDCLGLLMVLAKRFELPVEDHPDYRAYGRRGPSGKRPPIYRGRVMLEELDRVLDPGTVPEVGALGCFWLDRKKRFAQHVGIYARHPFGMLSLVHGDEANGQTVEVTFDQLWSDRLIRTYRIPGVVYP